MRMSRSVFEDPRLRARSFCRQERVVGTRTTLAGKFRIVRRRHSGERFMTPVVQRQIFRTPASVASKTCGPRVFAANLAFLQFGHRDSRLAEQGARANDLRRHVSCYCTIIRIEAAESKA